MTSISRLLLCNTLAYRAYFTKKMKYTEYGPFKRYSTRVVSELTHKHYTRLERHAREKYSSLLQKFENYNRKKFYNIGPWVVPLEQVGHFSPAKNLVLYVDVLQSRKRVLVGQIFEFVKRILFLKTYSGDGLAPSSQTV